jgi:hypothetical protein
VQQPGRVRTAAYAVLQPVGDDVAYGLRCSQPSFNRGAWEVTTPVCRRRSRQAGLERRIPDFE